MAQSLPVEALSGMPSMTASTVEAVLPPVAAAAGTGDDRSGAPPKAPRDIYDGVLWDIIKKLRCGNTLFFRRGELLSIKYAFDTYRKCVSNHMKILTLAKCFGQAVAINIVLQQAYRDEVAVSYRELQEKKAEMNEEISDILANKAKSILKHHRRYKRQFGPTRKYDDLKSNFRQRAIENPNLYWAYYRVKLTGTQNYYCAIEHMLADFQRISENQRTQRLRRADEYHYGDNEDEERRPPCYHCGGSCGPGFGRCYDARREDEEELHHRYEERDLYDEEYDSRRFRRRDDDDDD